MDDVMLHIVNDLIEGQARLTEAVRQLVAQSEPKAGKAAAHAGIAAQLDTHDATIAKARAHMRKFF